MVFTLSGPDTGDGGSGGVLPAIHRVVFPGKWPIHSELHKALTRCQGALMASCHRYVVQMSQRQVREADRASFSDARLARQAFQREFRHQQAAAVNAE